MKLRESCDVSTYDSSNCEHSDITIYSTAEKKCVVIEQTLPAVENLHKPTVEKLQVF